MRLCLRSQLICSFVLGVLGNDKTLIGCYSPQHLEIGTPGVIQCQFPSDFRAVYWFDNVTYENAQPALTYKDLLKAGPGYDSGEFDISLNGSLIIKKTSLLHEKTYKVICIGAKGLYNLFHILVIATVTPTQPSPSIPHCDNTTRLCFLQKQKNDILACEISGSRPASVVEWFTQINNELKLVNSSKTIKLNPDSTFVSISEMNLSVSNDRFIARFVCGTKQEHMSNWRYKPVIVDFLQVPAPLLKSIDMYFSINDLASFRCPLDSTNVILWKRYSVSTVQNIALWTKEEAKTEEIFDNEFSIGDDGSLVIRSVQLHHEGNYTCVASNVSTNIIKSFRLVVLVAPVPPYITISGCPTLHSCTIVSAEEGELTCTVFGVRPLVSLQWYIRDSDAVLFQKEETSVNEKSGLFYVSSRLYYRMAENTECREFSSVQCSAHGVSVATFLSVRELELHNVNCLKEPEDTSASQRGILSPAAITSLIAILVTVFGICIVAFLVLRKKSPGKANKTNEEGTNLEKLLPTEDNRKARFIADLKITYEELILNSAASQWNLEYEDLPKDIYVPNQLYRKVEQKISTRDTLSPLSSYRDLFEAEDLKMKHIVIEGDPGHGKTFFAMNIAKNWIKSDKEQPESQFDIFIMLSVKEMNFNKTLTDMIVEQLLPTDCNLKNDDIDYLLQNESRFLILLDEFEQYPERQDNESSIHNLMTRKVLRNAKVVLLTRPTTYTRTLGKGVAFVRLGSFEKSQVDQYVNLFFKEHESRGKDLKERLNENENIATICQTPFYLLMSAFIFLKSEYEEQTFKNITKFFDKMFVFLMQSFYVSNTTHDENVSFATINKQLTKRIAKVALDGFKHLQFSWSRKELVKATERGYIETLLKIGVLTEVDKIFKSEHSNSSKAEKFKFSHDLFQNFCGAHYLALHATSKEFGNYLHTLDVLTCQQLFVFTCGLSKEEKIVQKIVNHLLTKEDHYPFPIHDCIIQCLTEAICDNWAERMELLRNLCKKEYALSIRKDDSQTLKKAKAFLISVCSEYSIPLNTLSLCEVVQEVHETVSILQNGISVKHPKEVKSFSITDFQGICKDEHIMYIIENVSDLTEILVYSSIQPSICTQKGLHNIKKNGISAPWITFKGDNVVSVSLPLTSLADWVTYQEFVIIKYLEYLNGWYKLPEEEKIRNEKVTLSKIKEKGFEDFLAGCPELNTMKEGLISTVKTDMETIEGIINEWHWVFEAKTYEEEAEHYKKYVKHINELRNRFRVLQAFLPTSTTLDDEFKPVDVNDLQRNRENRMRLSSKILVELLQMAQKF